MLGVTLEGVGVHFKSQALWAGVQKREFFKVLPKHFRVLANPTGFKDFFKRGTFTGSVRDTRELGNHADYRVAS